LGEIVMSDPETAALLRAVLDKVCANISQSETSVRTRVASRLLEAARQGTPSMSDLLDAGRAALHEPPTMWR
jgi:hypothetical protein